MWWNISHPDPTLTYLYLTPENDCSIRVVSILTTYLGSLANWCQNCHFKAIYTKIMDPEGMENWGSTEQHYCSVLYTNLKIVMCFVLLHTYYTKNGSCLVYSSLVIKI